MVNHSQNIKNPLHDHKERKNIQQHQRPSCNPIFPGTHFFSFLLHPHLSHTTSSAVLRIFSIVASAFRSSESTQSSTNLIISCRAFLISASLLLFPPALFLYSLFSFIGRNHLIPPRTNTALPLILLSPSPTIHSPPLPRTFRHSAECRNITFFIQTEPFFRKPGLIHYGRV